MHTIATTEPSQHHAYMHENPETKSVTDFAYIRVSTSGSDKTQTIEVQRHKLAERYDTQGWQWFEDQGVGGLTNWGSENFQNLLERVKATHRPRVHVWKVDRLSRRMLTLELFWDALWNEEVDGTLVIGDTGKTYNRNSPASEILALKLLAVVGESENFDRNARTKAGLDYRKAQGLKLGRPSKLSNETRTRILRKFHEDGISKNAIAKEEGLSRPTVTRVIEQAAG